MAGIKKWQTPTSQRSDYRIYRAGREYTTRGPRPSRRKPNGVYDLIGVSPSAPRKVARAALGECLKAARIRAKNKRASPQSRSAATCLVKKLVDARPLLDCPESNAERVHRFRARQGKKAKKVQFATDVARRRFKGQCRARWGVGDDIREGQLVDCKRVRGVIEMVKGSNVNNNLTSATVIVRRSRADRRKDRRLGRYAAIPKELLVEQRQEAARRARRGQPRT